VFRLRGAEQKPCSAELGEQATPLKETIGDMSHYYLDESDPDILILRRQDGSFVAAFSARGATKEGIIEAAQEDHQGPPH
jgi:hypothetical protein